jgi:hypothetical protein
VIQTLAELGHTVVLAAERQRNRPVWLPKNLTLVNRGLRARGSPGRIEITACPVRRVDKWQHLAPPLRQARDYLRFLEPRYADKGKLERRSATHSPPGWPRFVREHLWISRHWKSLSRALALIEEAIPSEKFFDLFIQYEQPDVVLVTPLVDYGSYQTDYVKSAHRVGVPVVFVPFSWDNLTNRGLVRVAPDRVLVWNDIQKQEAVELHGVRSDRVIVTGAPRFDAFFAMQPSTSREAFCGRVGLDPESPFILYLCSSEFVAPREVEFVKRWAKRMRASDDPIVRKCGVLVRPHPVHAKQWKDVKASELTNAVIWAEKETMNADQGLYDSLHHAAACVGLNTSAMIEAGILGKPVMTLVSEEFAGGQEETVHFHYLRAANGGLLIEARNAGEHIQQLADVLRGNDGGKQTRRFIETFVRPRGLDRRVTPIMVEQIERAASIAKRPQGASAWHYPVRGAVLALFALRRIARRRRTAVRSPAPVTQATRDGQK